MGRVDATRTTETEQTVTDPSEVRDRDRVGYMRLVEALEITDGPKEVWGHKTPAEMQDAFLRVTG